MLLFATFADVLAFDSKLRTVIHMINGLLKISSFVLLVLATGGLSLKELTGEFRNAFGVIRRGECDKEVIIPLSNQPDRPRRAAAVEDDDDEEGPTVHVITPPAPTP